MAGHNYLSIEGVIGVGKTSLARLLQRELDAQLLLEIFEENPFLSSFYAEPDRYAFQTQIFFLLSRYRQAREVIPRLLQQGNVISDYTFAKDRLFAHQILQGDELTTYERLYAAMSENVATPDLVIYLYADTQVLMDRIAMRDRAMERYITPEYIDNLRQAYERFFSSYTDAPVLRIDTNGLDYIHSLHDLANVVLRVRSALREGTHQAELPDFAPLGAPAPTPDLAHRRLTDLQRWRRQVDGDAGPESDPFYSMMRFQQQVGELAGRLTRVWTLQDSLSQQYGNREEALRAAAARDEQALRDNLVECLNHILRLANRLGVDMERAYLQRLKETDEPHTPPADQEPM